MASSEQRGFSLVEITVAVAIIAVVAASSVAFALASRPTALWAATTQFDSMVSAARSIGAAYGDGATIFVSSSPGPSNFRADLYAHRPSATASATPMPSQVQPIIAQVAISESQVLGAPPFAVIIHGNGDIGVRKNYSRGDPVSDAELPCPPSNQLVFVFTVNGQTATRTITCHTALAYGGQTKQLPPPAAGPTPTPWSAPSCDAADNGCPTASGPAASSPPCPSGTTSYNGICRAPLVLTVNGPTVTPGECSWVSTLSPCAFSVSEQYYPPPNAFTVTSATSAPCTANYTISSGSGSGSLTLPNAYTLPANANQSPTSWSITPQALDGSSCTVIVYDDRGPADPNGSASFSVVTSSIPDPPITCPNGGTVGYGTPCPSPSPIAVCSTNCSVWYEDENSSEVTQYSVLDHDSVYFWTESDTLTQYITTDSGSTWTTGNACWYYSRNDVGGYFGDAYTYCNPPNSSGTSTGSYSTGPVWPATVAQMDNPENQSFLYRANDNIIQGQGATPTSGGLCGETITSNWNSVAPPGIATLPFNPPVASTRPLAPC